MRETKFNATGFEAFLVCDKTLKDKNAPFFKWLEDEGFSYGMLGHGHFPNVCWIYINLTSKLYIFGIPGIPLVNSVCNHAITIDEFKTIYEIYKKYEGKDIFVFHKNRFDYDREEGEEDDEDADEEPVTETILSELPPYEKFCDDVKAELNYSYYLDYPVYVDNLMNEAKTVWFLKEGYDSVVYLWKKGELSEQKYKQKKEDTADRIWIED